MKNQLWMRGEILRVMLLESIYDLHIRKYVIFFKKKKFHSSILCKYVCATVPPTRDIRFKVPPISPVKLKICKIYMIYLTDRYRHWTQGNEYQFLVKSYSGRIWHKSVNNAKIFLHTKFTHWSLTCCSEIKGTILPFILIVYVCKKA